MSTGLTFPLLYVVADFSYVGDERRWLAILAEVARAATDGGAAIQIRAKDVMDESLARRAREQVPPQVPLLLNGDAALAQRLGYGGVHWPEAAIPHLPVMSDGSPIRWQSAAVHSVKAVQTAECAGVDFVVFGSVFEPGSKPGVAAGLEALRVATQATVLPVVAIGGVTPERVPACLAAGAQGVAVVSGVLGVTSPARAMHAYLDVLRAHVAKVPQQVQKGECDDEEA